MSGLHPNFGPVRNVRRISEYTNALQQGSNFRKMVSGEAVKSLIEIQSQGAAVYTALVRRSADTRHKPVRKPLPDHLPRECVVIEDSTSCACCGSDRIVKIG